MIRKIVTINEERCNGCGKCAAACHEGAIDMVNGKAKLMREDYCDGLGDCLPACPMDAISFELREAPAYNEAAVLAAKKQKEAAGSCASQPAACPSMLSRMLAKKDTPASCTEVPGRLQNFPVQIKLVPTFGPFYENADLLIAADCTAFAYGAFHERFLKGRTTIIGCPKLDAVDYSEKLGEILKNNNIRSVTLVRMQVPCCGGLAFALQRAMEISGKNIPCQVVIVTPDGTILGER